MHRNPEHVNRLRARPDPPLAHKLGHERRTRGGHPHERDVMKLAPALKCASSGRGPNPSTTPGTYSLSGRSVTPNLRPGRDMRHRTRGRGRAVTL